MLSLESNEVGGRAAVSLARSLLAKAGQASCLQKLSFNHNKVGDASADELREALGDALGSMSDQETDDEEE